MRRPSDYQKRKLRDLLRQIREDSNIRQIDLARHLGKPQSFVSKFESGERTLDFLEVREVCQALGITLSDFVRLFEDDRK